MKILFYTTAVLGFFLLGNEVLHKSYQLGPEKLLALPPGFREIPTQLLVFRTHTEPSFDLKAIRTYLVVVLSKISPVTTFCTCQGYFLWELSEREHLRRRFRHGKVARRFENKLHGYSHLLFEDVVEKFVDSIVIRCGSRFGQRKLCFTTVLTMER